MIAHPNKHNVPHLITALPGPNAQKLIAGDERYTSPSYTRFYPLAVKRGYGAVIEDVDGNLFLDFTAGIAVCATGHCHPRVVRAIKRQADNLLHMSGTDFYNEPQRALAEKLAQFAPGAAPKRVFFTNSGAEAIEAAIKLARYHTGRQHLIAFEGAFHGRTMGALSLTASKAVQRRGFGPFVPGVMHVEFPNVYRRPEHQSVEQCAREAIENIEQSVFTRTVSPDEVAAIFVEPIQGEGGYIVPPPGFLNQLQDLCRRHGILLVADEVQSGMGRTGKMFACEHWGIEPDIVCLAKGIASGLPLGAIVARSDVMTWPRGSHASTFGGNPLACVAALETIALLESGLIENAAQTGAYLMEKLAGILPTHRLMGDVRGKGLMVAVELVKDKRTKERAPAERDDLMQRCFHKGLLLLGCGPNSIRFAPPLIIDKSDVDTAVALFDEALSELEAGVASLPRARDAVRETSGARKPDVPASYPANKDDGKGDDSVKGAARPPASAR